MSTLSSLTLPKLGNTGVSSLIKSAQSLTTELATYNDTVAKLTFDNSAKTASDLQTYTDYLNSRVGVLEGTGTVVDATKALNMRQEVVSATHSSMSADIQRSTIAVLDGQGTSDDKLAAIGNAFQSLYAVGDLSAAQSYEEQYYSYYQTVQLQKQEAASALGGAGSSSNPYSSIVTAAVNTITSNIQNANAAFSAQGPKFLDQQVNGYLKTQAQATGTKALNGSASIFAALAGQIGMVNKGVQFGDTTKYSQGTYTPGSILDIYTQALALDPSHASTYQSAIDGYITNHTGIPLPGDSSKTMTYTALQNTVYAGNSGNAPYGLAQGADGSWNVVKENITGYTFGTDQNGNPKLMPNYSFFTPTLSKDQSAALAKTGVNFKGDGNGDYWFQPTIQASWLGKALGTTNVVQGVLQKNGSIEFATQDGRLLQMVKDTKGLYGLQQVNQFGQVVNANIAGEYGFTPAKTELTVGTGSTNFMTKVLGQTATPEQVGNKTIYQANGKMYQLVTDSRGLKGLQQIDQNGKILNSNVAGQYGFSPDSLARGNNQTNNPIEHGQQFAATLVNQHQQWLNGITDAQNPNFKGASEGIHALSPGWLGVSTIINNAQMMASINQVHDQTMAALAAQAKQAALQAQFQAAAQAALHVAAPTPQPSLKVAAPAPTSALHVAQASGTSVGGSNVSPQQTANPQGGNANGNALNQSGQGTGISLSAPASLPGIRL